MLRKKEEAREKIWGGRGRGNNKDFPIIKKFKTKIRAIKIQM